MCKGIIIELKENEKVILADNGRFYIVPAKKGDLVGKRVCIYSAKKRAASIALILFIAFFAYYGGVFINTAANLDTPKALVQIEINPCAEFLLNGGSKVLSAAPLNKEGAMILAGEDFEGLTVENAANLFISLAVSCGFIDIQSGANAVYVHNIGDSKEKTEKLSAAVSASVESYLNRNSLRAVILNNVVPRGFETAAENYGCESGRYRLYYIIYKIYESGGDKRSFEEIAAELNGKTVPGLLSIIKQAHISYSQKLSREKEIYYAGQKQLRQKAFYQELERFISSPESVKEFNIWKQYKQDYILSLSQGYNQNFTVPLYAAEFH